MREGRTQENTVAGLEKGTIKGIPYATERVLAVGCTKVTSSWAPLKGRLWVLAVKQ